CVPPDNRQLLKHPHAVLDVAEAGARIVRPTHRHLYDPETALQGDKQDLRVKAPALYRRQLEDSLSGRTGKCLETALGVGKLQPHYGADNQVEAAAEKLAVQRLPVGLAAGFQPPGADGDVRTLCDGGK